MNSQDLIIEQCREGNSRAQMELYKQYAKGMFNCCRRLLNDDQDAEDMMQEAFLKAFQRLDQFSGGVSFGAWLKKIMIHQCLDHIKRQEIDWISTEDSNIELEQEEATDHGQYEMDKVYKAIDALPGGYKMILSLYLLEGYDHEEIGQILEIDPGTSRSQYARAKNKLKGILKERNYV